LPQQQEDSITDQTNEQPTELSALH